jgi:hypothetical protein
VNDRVPVARLADSGANATLSEQLVPGAIGDADTQFWVAVNDPVTATFVTLRGAVPVFVRLTVCGPLVVPTLCGPNVRLDGETEARGVAAEPVNTYVAPSYRLASMFVRGAPTAATAPFQLRLVE